jgi:small GTP-binding protein
MNIVIVGHVNHGKSTLIGRLLYDTDSLPDQKIEEIKETCRNLGHKLEFAYVADALEEERKNEMTIDTTQTFFKGKRRDYVIIDAPGHKEFLKNMITGASQADAAVLIIDAKEGVKEQTKRHAYLLSLLGIEQVILTINKMDLIGYDRKIFEKIKVEIINYLDNIGIRSTFIIPISAYEGDNIVNKSKNMNWYKGFTFLEALNSFEIVFKDYDFRFPVQDVYDIEGKKVCVGNIVSGEIKEGEKIKIFPEGRETEVKKIIVLGKELKIARKPKSVGIIINDNVKRGEIFCKGKPPIITKEIQANVFCMIGKLELNEEYTFCCATQKISCKIDSIKEVIDVLTLVGEFKNILKETEVGKIKLVLDKPIVIEKFNTLPDLGRFVLEKNDEIIAGGILL